MANIVKVECNTKKQLADFFRIAEAHPILYKYSESRVQYKNALALFHQMWSSTSTSFFE